MKRHKSSVVYWVSVFFFVPLLNCVYAGETPTGSSISKPSGIDIDKNGQIARDSVAKVICGSVPASGFAHKSGRVITAEHVVRGCTEVLLEHFSGKVIKASVVATDADLDLALLKPESVFGQSSLNLSKTEMLKYGTLVSSWGFPYGYPGPIPFLIVGYFSGAGVVKEESGRLMRRFYFNAAFNGGQSGAPVVDLESGEVIGLVNGKSDPISKQTKMDLEFLSKRKSGVTHSVKRSDGSTVKLSESQVIAEILEDFSKNIQSVIGTAVRLADLRKFLVDQGIDP
jgi:S1-C subfamily serine protease